MAQAPSPELLRNGGFENGLNHWTAAGFADNPGLETFNTSGLGPSLCFAANPNVAPFGFSGYTLTQPIAVVAGQRYAFRVDASYEAPAGSIAASGTLTVQVDSTVVVQGHFGQLAIGELTRDALCSTFVATRTGVVPFQFTLHKLIFPFMPTARMRIDNFSIRRMDGPLVCVRGNRRPGDTVSVEVAGTPNANYVVWLAPQRAAMPLPFAGFAGALELQGAALFATGALSSAGSFTSSFTIPARPHLAGLPLEFQATRLHASLVGGFGPAQSFGIQM